MFDLRSLKQLVAVSGDAAYFHYSITVRGNEDFAALSRIREEQSPKGQMQEEMNDAVRALLGKDFYVRTVTVGRGSIELIVVLAAAGTFYMGFSRYKNFVESAELLKSQLQGIVRRFIPEAADVKATWLPASSLAAGKATLASSGQSTLYPMTMILLWYVILSHAALLVMAIWIIYRRLMG